MVRRRFTFALFGLLAFVASGPTALSQDAIKKVEELVAREKQVLFREGNVAKSRTLPGTW